MKKEDAEKLEDGVYTIHWANKGGSSVGVISVDARGDKRLHCSNWSSASTSILADHLDFIERVELLSNQKGDKGRLPESFRIIEELSRHNQPPIAFAVEETQPPSKTLMELAYGEEAELIRAATSLLNTFLGVLPHLSKQVTGEEGEALKAAADYLASKFKGEPDVESD